MDITSFATALVAVLSGFAAVISVWVKSLQERNSRRVQDLEKSNEYLETQLKNMREISDQINSSYASVLKRVESLELENASLRVKNIELHAENDNLRERISSLEKAIRDKDN